MSPGIKKRKIIMADIKKRKSADFIYWGLYVANVAIMLLLIWMAYDMEGPYGALAITFFSYGYLMPPFSTLFLIINLWGLKRDKAHKLRYLISIPILILWNLWEWYIVLP